jgi:hypothetical protein
MIEDDGFRITGDQLVSATKTICDIGLAFNGYLSSIKDDQIPQAPYDFLIGFGNFVKSNSPEVKQ